MTKVIFSVFLLFLTTFFVFPNPKTAHAIYDPLSVSNNKFGIHIIDSNDLQGVHDLVNSQGGDWGYVTLVIQKGDRNRDTWQKVFDHMRRLHLIPLVRIATRPQGDIWEKPNPDEIDGWVSFLNSLNWVIKNRYIIIANEPNHSKEWGGEINPEEYASYLETLSQKLKATSDDFFVLQAGFDASAPNSKDTMDETTFITRMITSHPTIFNSVDGWTSHSYPNPGFSAAPTEEGRGSLKTYNWELDFLKSKGITNNFPVFITETGWSQKNLTQDKISEYYTYAYQNVWTDPKIVAVTPFIFNYITEPFQDFSWKKQDSTFYSFYNTVQNLPKLQGKPVQINKAQILAGFIPQKSLVSGYVPFTIAALNTGQVIWNTNDISLNSNSIQHITVKGSIPEKVEPGNITIFAGIAKVYPFASYLNSFINLHQDNKVISNNFYFTIQTPVLKSPIDQLLQNIFSKLMVGR